MRRWGAQSAFGTCPALVLGMTTTTAKEAAAAATEIMKSPEQTLEFLVKDLGSTLRMIDQQLSTMDNSSELFAQVSSMRESLLRIALARKFRDDPRFRAEMSDVVFEICCAMDH